MSEARSPFNAPATDDAPGGVDRPGRDRPHAADAGDVDQDAPTGRIERIPWPPAPESGERPAERPAAPAERQAASAERPGAPPLPKRIPKDINGRRDASWIPPAKDDGWSFWDRPERPPSTEPPPLPGWADDAPPSATAPRPAEPAPPRAEPPQHPTGRLPRRRPAAPPPPSSAFQPPPAAFRGHPASSAPPGALFSSSAPPNDAPGAFPGDAASGVPGDAAFGGPLPGDTASGPAGGPHPGDPASGGPRPGGIPGAASRPGGPLPGALLGDAAPDGSAFDIGADTAAFDTATFDTATFDSPSTGGAQGLGPVGAGATGTVPGGPGPSGPGPVAPGPVDPHPVDPGPVDPGPVDSGPRGPVPAAPVPADAMPPGALAAPLAQPGPAPSHPDLGDPMPVRPELYRRSTLAPGGYDVPPHYPVGAQATATPGAGTGTATTTGPIQRGKRPRDPYLDNVKFLLISLVPLGHSLVPTLAAHSSRSAYLFIYVFHMPLFVIISGYLSRTFWNSNAKTNKLVATFLVPYVFVEIGYGLLRVAFGHKWSLSITDPAWLNWYLIALLLWRLATPVMKRLRYPITVSIVLYLLAGMSDLDGNFSMDRFFGLMPFFVIGLMLRPEHLDLLNRRWVKVAAGFVLAGAAGVAILLAPHVKLAPIYYARNYHAMHMTWWMGMGTRAALLVAALIMSAAILALVPRGRTWFSDLGTRTLYAYLLHGVVVMTAKEMGWLSVSWLHGPLGVLAIACSAFALTILLCLPETRKLFKWMLEPQLSWLYKTSNRA